METAAGAGARSRRERAPRERLLFPVRHALLRLRLRPTHTVLVGFGVAVGAAVLALTAVGSGAVQDRAVQRALAQLQPSDRAIQALWSGVPGQSNFTYPQLDRIVRRAVQPILGQSPFAVTVFRQATWGGAFVNLGAVDGLARWLDLRSGRLPRRCTPTDCELVQIGGAPAAPRFPFLHVVGRATLVAGAPFATYFGAGGKRPPILLANGVLPFERVPLPDAPLIARTYGWIVPVAPRSIHDWELASLGARLGRAQASLEERSDIFSIAAPTDTISAIRATSRVAAERLLILGGDAAVLLLGFALLAATRLRRDHRELRQRLMWAGASRSQTLLVEATEVVGITVLASIVGWAGGSAAGALLARRLGSPGALVVEHSILTWRTLGIAVALAAVTVVAMLAVLRVDTIAFGGIRVTVADAAALGALAAVLLALARGKADASALAQSGGTGVMLLLLPGLVLLVLAVAAARMLAPVIRALEWSARRANPSLRIAFLSLARSPGDVLMTVVFFVLSVGIAVFAIAYRATLLRGEHDQAVYAVPAPFVLQEDLGKLVTIQQVSLPPVGRATPVLRGSGYITANGSRDFTVLALPAAALPSIDGWRSDFSSRSPAELAALIRPAATPKLRGVALPRGAKRLSLPLSIRGAALGVTLVVENARGDFTPIILGEIGKGAHLLTVHVPPESRGGKVVAIRLSFPVLAAFVAGHRETGTTVTANDASTGTLTLGRLRAGTTSLRPFADWFGTNGIRADGARFHYLLNRAADSIIRPHEPLEGEAVPVIASPGIARAAGPDGVVPLFFANSVIPARVVATTRYFPSVDGDVVVADLPTWLTAANTAEPGLTAPSELWIDARPSASAALGKLPLATTSQAARAHELGTDPLARGAISLLLVTALVGLALAAAGLLLTVAGDLRDDRGALFDLEAQGATPAEIRRHVLLRAGVVGTLGVGAGIAAGAIVSALVVGVVTVTAGAADALPPLSLEFGVPLLAAALGLVALASAAGALLATRSAR